VVAVSDDEEDLLDAGATKGKLIGTKAHTRGNGGTAEQHEADMSVLEVQHLRAVIELFTLLSETPSVMVRVVQAGVLKCTRARLAP